MILCEIFGLSNNVKSLNIRPKRGYKVKIVINIGFRINFNVTIQYKSLMKVDNLNIKNTLLSPNYSDKIHKTIHGYQKPNYRYNPDEYFQK